jgi:hypothetical protein
MLMKRLNPARKKESGKRISAFLRALSFGLRTLILTIVISLGIVGILVSCGGGGDGSTSEDNNNGSDESVDDGSDGSVDNGSDESVDIPKSIWSYDPDLKNPVTDLADCTQSVLDCIENGTKLENCFDSDVKICTGAEPTNFCCTQECAEQITAELDRGASQHEAILEVFVYDGTCMPNIPEDEY